MSGLQQASIDIHPIPWKNLLIIPYAVKGLTPGWDQAEGKDYRLGQARNKLKTNNFRRASALIATWEQFATYGTKGFANTLQKDLKSHGVKLNAQVEISFDDQGTIRPNVPWWDNEYAADNGKRQVGGRATAEEAAVRDSYDGLGAGVGIYHTKTSSSGVQFYSQVGFAWQYKIPTHSRSNLHNTDWILATDENGDPFKEFNLPKGTTEYAVRLCFIKADGNVVPLSNVITGSDVQQKMEALINKKIKGSTFVPHAERYVAGVKQVAGTREDANVWTQVSETDRKRLTRKARALLNIQAEVNMETFTQKIIPLKQILNTYDALVMNSEETLENIGELNQVVERYLAQAYQALADGTQYNGQPWLDPADGITPIAPPTTGSSGQPVNDVVPLVVAFANVNEKTDPVDLDRLFSTPVLTTNPLVDYNPQNPIDVIQQARRLKRDFNDPAINSAIAARDSAIDRYNDAVSAVEDMEQKMVAWSAGGHYDNFSTEHAPGLVSKDREVSQVISFTKTRFPSKRAKEEAENNSAAAAGAAPPHMRSVPVIVTDPITGDTTTIMEDESTAGFWNPFTEDLPDEACIQMEPQLRTFRDEESLGLLNAGQLRVHNYSGSPGTVDVSGETPSIGFTAWKNEQARIATKFNDAKNPRDLTKAEQRINDFNSRNITGKINFSLKSSRAAALIQAQKTREKEEREKFEQQEAVLQRQLDVAQQARDTLQADRNAEIANIRATDQKAQATALRLVQISDDTKKKEIDLVRLKNEIDLLNANIAAAETKKVTQSGLTAQEEQQLQADKLTLQTQTVEMKNVEKEIEVLSEQLKQTNEQYNKDVVAGFQKKEADLDDAIKDAEKKLDDLNRQFRITLRAAETAAQEAAARLEKRVAILAKSTEGDALGLEKDIMNGNIALGAKNATIGDINRKIAPADLRFGGGYYWKEAEDIKSSPFGQYLAYDPTGTKGDRMELMWSELNPDDSRNSKEDVVLYRYTDANTPSVKAISKRTNVQPLLTDNIYVKAVAGNRLEPTQSLFRLTKANTQSKANKSIVYIGSRAVGNQIVDGVTENVSVLEFYETLPKPGSFVHFVLNSKSSDEARIDARFGDRGRIRNRLRTLSTAFKIHKDVNGNEVIEMDNPERLVGLTGRIESIHIGNLKTTLNTKKEEDAEKVVTQLTIERQTEASKPAPDPTKVKTLTQNIIQKSNELQQLRKENGHFNFAKFKADGGTYQAVVLADIRISSDPVTGLVKNVLFADCAVVNPYADTNESTVLYKEDRYREYKASVFQANKDDTIRIVSGSTTVKVNKENILPRFQNTTKVMFYNKAEYNLGDVAGFSNGYYIIDDYQGNTFNINPDDVQALETNTTDALDIIENVNEDINTIESGLRKSRYVALYHNMFVTDVDMGGVVEKKCEELEAYVGNSVLPETRRGFSGLNETNYAKYRPNSDPPTFNTAPDVLFRAEFKPANALTMHKVTGDFNNPAFLDKALLKLMSPGASSRDLADDGNTYEVETIMGEVVMVQATGQDKQMVDSQGNVIQNQVITIRYQDKVGAMRYANIDVAGLQSIKVPHAAIQVKPLAADIGFRTVSESLVRNMVPQKAINITAPVRSSLMMAKSMPATFALTSGTEGDTDLVEDVDEAAGWTSSWAQETVALWATSSSSSDEQMLKALSDVEQLVPTWASSSSGDESVEKAAWATTSASGGFASSTSDDDADDLATIISKIDRESKPVSAAWAEDSESDD